jgi:hypothetical protein
MIIQIIIQIINKSNKNFFNLALIISRSSSIILKSLQEPHPNFHFRSAYLWHGHPNLSNNKINI